MGTADKGFRGTYSYLVGDSENPNRLLLIRHGEVETTGVLYGQMDVGLSERGRGQSRDLLRRLKPHSIDAVYSSDLQRAGYAAQIVADQRSLPLHVRPELRERMFGDWQGKSWDEIREISPEPFEAYLKDFLTAAIPGDGESYFHVRDRVMPVVEEAMGEGKGRTVAMVSHAGVIRVILTEALGMPLRNLFRFQLDYASLSIIDFHPNGRRVVRLVNGL